MNYLSFLVDNLPLHYYQAELLLFSLEKFTSFKKNNILVHCTTRVNDDFLLFLKENGYSYKIIEPYLDGKYCNKLQQLSSFLTLNDNDAVFLVDADTFFLNDPIMSFTHKIGGKVVDAPNPPLSVLSKIFNEAKLPYPKIVPADWDMENSSTFECNFNGGFYYVPAKKVKQANTLWRKWAEWLYARLELFDTKKQQIHVDQVSFSMMVKEANFDYEVLVSNNNCPIHYKRKQRLFNEKQEVSMLHYHRSLNVFGLLSKDLYINEIVDRAIDKANQAIVDKKDFKFYKQFNKSFIIKPKNSEKTKIFESKIKVLFEEDTKKIKCILHAGTPKTGTTSLQFLLDKNYSKLLEQDILYPKYYLDTNPPKHQWLVQLLMKNDFEKLFEYLEEIVKESLEKDVKTIFLSTEGIYNHWWDFSSEAKEILKIISKYFDFELCVVFREPTSFLESFYKQNLKNPQIIMVECYGKDLSFSQILEDKWFIKHLDYLGFIQEAESLFGKGNIKVFSYSKEIIADILKYISFNVDMEESTKSNVGQTSIGVELLRVLNKYNLNIKDKKESVDILKKMDILLKKYNNNSILNVKNNEDIEKLFVLQSINLKSYK